VNNRPWLVVFHKEVRDGLRDRRSVFSALTFCWLGPLLVGVLWKQPTALALLPAFLIISAFTGAMNIANDTTAGERERNSLEPLLMNPVRLSDLVFGKFLATCSFSLACVALTLLFALAVLYATPLGGRMHPGALLWMFAVAAPLVPLAAGVDLLICTFAQTPKRRQLVSFHGPSRPDAYRDTGRVFPHPPPGCHSPCAPVGATADALRPDARRNPAPCVAGIFRCLHCAHRSRGHHCNRAAPSP